VIEQLHGALEQFALHPRCLNEADLDAAARPTREQRQ